MIVFWLSFFCLVFYGIVLTQDALGFRTGLPRICLKNHCNELLEESATEISSGFQNVTGTNVTTCCSQEFDNFLPNSETNVSSDSFTRRPMQEKKITHLAFLKVHKAGSSTMQNIFFRFGIRNKLNILLPKFGNYLFPYTPKMPLEPSQHFDIFACHTTYKKKWFDSLLPADSVKIGIVREPVSRMISASYYHRDIANLKYLKKVPSANFIHNLVLFPEKYDNKTFSMTRNRMGSEFGFPKDISVKNTDKIKKYLDELNSQFLLVLVLEKFDESLVLMKRLLNWSLFDILYLIHNSHRHRPIVLNKTEIAKFRNTSFLDFEIYEYFSKVLETKIQEANSVFIDEVSFFKTALQNVRVFCYKKNKTANPTLVIPKSKWEGEVKVSYKDCELMRMQEFRFIEKLRQIHNARRKQMKQSKVGRG